MKGSVTNMCITLLTVACLQSRGFDDAQSAAAGQEVIFSIEIHCHYAYALRHLWLFKLIKP